MSLPESRALHAKVRDFMRRWPPGAIGEELDAARESLAVEIGRHQAAVNPGYARLCALQGGRFVHAIDFPAVPTDAFKVTRVAAFPEEEAVAVFRTSGTTVGARGRHDLRDLGTYDQGALAMGRACLVGDLERVHVLVLGPSPRTLPDSSLTHMNALFARELTPAVLRAREPAGGPFFLEGETFDLAALDELVAAALVEETPVLLLGTSFAFVHLLDALGEERLPLPPRSRVMQTGGFKGRSREVDAAQLRMRIARMFDVPERDVVQEYGMTELSSQCYERTAVDASAPAGVLVPPPWMRVVPVDPETLRPSSSGEGLARIEDLANVDSVFAVLTGDMVRAHPHGFELLGRRPGAPPRGCSLAIEELANMRERAS